MRGIYFWLNCARLYTLPITVLSWLVIFIYSLKSGGNALLGLFALVGISFVHLATNLIDDYFDYKALYAENNSLEFVKKFKCTYLRENKASIPDLRNVIIIFMLIGGFIGLYLFLVCGTPIIYLALAGAFIAVSYPFLSQRGFGEIAVILAYGPLLFEGVYFVMCKSFSIEVLILSLSCSIITNTILYTHMLMDYDQDKISHKKTLCLLLGSKSKALYLLLVFYFTSYILTGVLCAMAKNYLYLLPIITLPMAIELYNLVKQYNSDKSSVPQKRFWHGKIDSKVNTQTQKESAFFFRFLYSRNIMLLFMFLTCIGIIFG